MKYIFLIAGGAIGTFLRFISSSWIAEHLPHFRFPWGTFFVNLAGSFLIGFLAGMNQHREWNVEIKTFLFAGLLGGFTTYSSYALESLTLIRAGEFGLTLIYITSTTFLGLIMAAGGYWLGLQLFLKS